MAVAEQLGLVAHVLQIDPDSARHNNLDAVLFVKHLLRRLEARDREEETGSTRRHLGQVRPTVGTDPHVVGQVLLVGVDDVRDLLVRELYILRRDFLLPLAPHQVASVEVAGDLNAILELLHDPRGVVLLEGLSFVRGKVEDLLDPLGEVYVVLALCGLIPVLVLLALHFFF